MNLISFLIIFATITLLIYFWEFDDEDSFLQKRLEKLSQNVVKDTKISKTTLFLHFFKPYITKITNSDKNRDKIKQMLLEAGLPSSDEEVIKFTGRRFVLMAFGVAFALCLFMLSEGDSSLMMISFCAPVLLYMMPLLTLRRAIQQRKEEIMYTLPDALDLLTICVEAGLGLDAALERVSSEFARTSTHLASELSRVNKDILAGISRQDAFRGLSLRNNVEDLKSLAALLIQTDKLGTSISQSLRVYCDTVRTRRRQRVEALAAQASIKMTIPMVLFILPSVFIVILVPALISMSQNMK